MKSKNFEPIPFFFPSSQKFIPFPQEGRAREGLYTIYFLFTILLFFFHSNLSAQVDINFPKKEKKELEEVRSTSDIDLNGLWEGEINQLTWVGQPEFNGAKGKLHVEIEQKGSKVKGLIVCRARFANNKGYLSYEKTFEGIWDGDRLKYKDIKVENYINTHRELRHLETCIKTADLYFYKFNGHYHLEGEWEGAGHISEVPCVPGKIHLTKVNEDEFMEEEATTFNVNFEQKDNLPVELKWDKSNTLKKIRNRNVKDGKKIKVASKYLSITVYDHKRNDGDIISLHYNGNWILERFKINNKEHQVDVMLDDTGKVPNYLLLYAHNLGESPPNTCAVIVNDGVKRQRFILNADMNTSDVIYFEYEGE